MDDTGRFGRFYRRHVGEPEHPGQVAGYLTFLAAVAVALLGVGGLLAREVLLAGIDYGVRRMALALVGLAGPLLAISLASLIQVGRRARRVVAACGVPCLLAVAMLWWVYPSQFYVPGAADYGPLVLGGYALGLAAQAVVLAVAPLLGGGTVAESESSAPAEPADRGLR